MSQRWHALLRDIDARSTLQPYRYLVREESHSMRNFLDSRLIDQQQDGMPSYPAFLGRLRDRLTQAR